MPLEFKIVLEQSAQSQGTGQGTGQGTSWNPTAGTYNFLPPGASPQPSTEPARRPWYYQQMPSGRYLLDDESIGMAPSTADPYGLLPPGAGASPQGNRTGPVPLSLAGGAYSVMDEIKEQLLVNTQEQARTWAWTAAPGSTADPQADRLSMQGEYRDPVWPRAPGRGAPGAGEDFSLEPGEARGEFFDFEVGKNDIVAGNVPSAADFARSFAENMQGRGDVAGISPEKMRELMDDEEVQRRIEGDARAAEARAREIRIEQRKKELDSEVVTGQTEAGMDDVAGFLQNAGFGGAAGKLGQLGQLAQAPEALSGLMQGVTSESLAAAAGPVGAIVAVVQESMRQLAARADAARESIQFLGDVTAQAASNDYMGAFNRTVDAASGSLEQIPIVGGVLASSLELLVQPVRTFTDVADAFVARGKQLQGYSGDLASANAIAEIRSLLGDLREADTLGPGIARLTDAQSRFYDAFRELMEPIKKVVIEQLAKIMEDLAIFLEAVKPWMAGVMESLRVAVDLLGDIATGSIRKAWMDVKTAAERISKSMDDEIARKRALEETDGNAIQTMVAELGQDALRAPVAPAAGLAPSGLGLPFPKGW